jgi:hypothetical protein
MDYLLTHLEHSKQALSHTKPSQYKAAVNLGCQKLDHYYQKTDANPAYIMAVFLHPHYRQHWFNKYWSQLDVNAAMATIQRVYDHSTGNILTKYHEGLHRSVISTILMLTTDSIVMTMI